MRSIEHGCTDTTPPQLNFYWILETSRRRCINLTLLVCGAGLSIGSEFVQALIPNNGREFDPYDIAANIAGSGLSLFLCSWYHKRMLERKRKNKHYDIVPGEEGEEEEDVELGLVREHETDRAPVETNGDVSVGAAQKTNVSEELDNWDENAEDWEDPGEDDVHKAEEDDTKKRTD